MKIISVMNDFKGTLSAAALNRIVAEEARRAGFACRTLLASDGGDGFLATCPGTEVECTGRNAYGKPHRFSYKRTEAAAYLELAKVTGLACSPQRNVFAASSFGLGAALAAVAADNPDLAEVYLGIGGSAHHDAGAGLLAALGARFFTADGALLSNITLARLGEIDKIETSDVRRRAQTFPRLTIIADVRTPLAGPNNATEIFAVQKGAQAKDLPKITALISHFTGLVEQDSGRALQAAPFTGAAGGVGFALASYFEGEFISGSELALRKLAALYEPGDLIVTGEGKFDRQSLLGKLPGAIKSAFPAATLVLAGQSEYAEPGVYPIVPDVADLSVALAAPERTFRALVRRVFTQLRAEKRQ